MATLTNKEIEKLEEDLSLTFGAMVGYMAIKKNRPATEIQDDMYLSKESIKSSLYMRGFNVNADDFDDWLMRMLRKWYTDGLIVFKKEGDKQFFALKITN